MSALKDARPPVQATGSSSHDIPSALNPKLENEPGNHQTGTEGMGIRAISTTNSSKQSPQRAG